jgi:TetR/AcrR family transcriptional regulator, tetracycline repressor protein
MAQRALSPAVIRAAALELVGEGGYTALSMRNLGARLGVKAASLYYHVPNRAALLRLIADYVAVRAASSIGPAGDWRAALTGLARSLRRTLGEHPGATVIVATQDVSPEVWQPLVPPILSLMHATLEVTDETALFLVQSLYVLVTGLALAEFGDAPEPPAAPPEFYDTWFDIAVAAFLAGVAAQYAPG